MDLKQQQQHTPFKLFHNITFDALFMVRPNSGTLLKIFKIPHIDEEQVMTVYRV